MTTICNTSRSKNTVTNQMWESMSMTLKSFLDNNLDKYDTFSYSSFTNGKPIDGNIGLTEKKINEYFTFESQTQLTTSMRNKIKQQMQTCSLLNKYIVITSGTVVDGNSINYVAMKFSKGKSNLYGFLSLLTDAWPGFSIPNNPTSSAKKDIVDDFNDHYKTNYTTNDMEKIKTKNITEAKAQYNNFVTLINNLILVEGGAKKSKYTRTKDPKVKTPKGMRCVYVGHGGAKYVKLGGVFVNIKKLPK